LIPVFVVSGEAGASTKAVCRDLGATACFEKPIDFSALRTRLAEVLEAKRVERRSEVRVRLPVMLKLKGLDRNGKPFEELTFTENVSMSAFLSGSTAKLKKDSLVEVFLLSGGEQLAGRARVIRAEAENMPYPRYGLRFVERPSQWLIQ